MAKERVQNEITSYAGALEAMDEVLRRIKVFIKPEDIKYFPWQKSKTAHIEKKRRLIKGISNKVEEIRKLYQELISLQVAEDVLGALEPVSKTEEILSRARLENADRAIIITDKAKRKLKKLSQKNYRAEKMISSDPRPHLDDYPAELGGNLADSMEEGLRALSEQSLELAELRHKHDLEKAKNLPKDERVETLIAEATELLTFVEDTLRQHYEYIDNGVPLDKRKVVLTDEESAQAEKMAANLRNYLDVMSRYVNLFGEISDIEFNLDRVREALVNKVKFGTTGYELVSELEEELERDLKADRAELLTLSKEIDGESKVLSTVEDVLHFLELNNFQFKVIEERNARFGQKRPAEEKISSKEKQGMVIKTIKETARARQIYELYLVDIAGKGPNVESFKEYASKHAIEPVYIDYVEMMIHEEERILHVERGYTR